MKLINWSSGDLISIKVNVLGMVLWTVLYYSLSIHNIPSEVSYIHNIYFVLLMLFLGNIKLSDNQEASLSVEMKLKDDVENLSSRLCILVVTVLFSTSVLVRYKHVPKKVKQHFMSILCMAIILLLGISSSISTPKNAKHIRTLRKFESMIMNVAIGLIGVAFVYMIHYM